MQHLNITSAIHMGTSGGGPYACACAALYPKTTAGLVLVASTTHCSGPDSGQLLQGMSWFDRIGYSMIAYLPHVTALALAVAAPLVAAAPAVAKFLQQVVQPPAMQDGSHDSGPAGLAAARFCKQDRGNQQYRGLVRRCLSAAQRAILYVCGAFLPAADRIVSLNDAGAYVALVACMLADAFAQGSEGLFQYKRLTTPPWGFELMHVTVRALLLQGDADINVTIEQAKYLLRQLPNVEMHVYPGASHFSLLTLHAYDMLSHVKAEFMPCPVTG